MTRRLGIIVAATLAAALVQPVTSSSVSAAPTWLPDASPPLSAAVGATSAPQVAVNSRGGAVVAWTSVNTASEPDRVEVAVRTRAAGGGWRPITWLSGASPVAEASQPAVAMSDNGTAMVMWVSMVDTGTTVERSVLVSRQVDGTWGPPRKLSPLQAVAHRPDVALDAQGRAVAVWVSFNPGEKRLVEAANFLPGTGWTGRRFISIRGKPAANPKVDITAAGAAMAVWTQTYDDMTTNIRSRAQMVGRAWGKPRNPSRTVPTREGDRADVDVQGVEAVVIWRNGSPGAWRVWTARLNGDNGWRRARALGATTASDDLPRVALDGRGNATALWTDEPAGGEPIVRWSTQPTSGLWAPPAAVAVGVNGGSPALTVGSRGFTAATWVDSAAELRGSIRRSGDAAWTTRVAPLSTGGAEASTPAVGIDGTGNATAVWAEGNSAPWTVQTATLDVAGPVSTMVRPAATFQRQLATLVSWRARDLWSDIDGMDVRRRSAGARTAFSPWSTWLADTALTSRSFKARAGRTHCISVRARDAVGNQGAWSPQRCTATPVDDRALKGRGWKRVGSSKDYLGTATLTARKGVRLASSRVQAKQLSLLAARCPTCGTVRVRWNDQLLRTVSLKGKRASRAVIPLRTFTSLRTGRVSITVTTKGKPVRIDGLGVSRV